MNKTKKNYIPFIAGMATMILLACLISASLAKEDPPAAQSPAETQVQVQAGDLRLASSEAGVALFGVERVAPSTALKTESGAELPAVLTCTDEKGEVHYYVEAETIGDILDVAVGVTYREDINCVDFGTKAALDASGKQRVTNGKPDWYSGSIKCDINYTLTYDNDGNPIAYPWGSSITSNGFTYSTRLASEAATAEDRAERMQRAERQRQAAALKPTYGLAFGMYTEEDPAKVDMASWSGTAMKDRKLQSDEEGRVRQSFAFTPYLGEYAVITIENPNAEDIWVNISRPDTVGNGSANEIFTGGLRIPAGQKLVRAFSLDRNRPLEN